MGEVDPLQDGISYERETGTGEFYNSSDFSSDAGPTVLGNDDSMRTVCFDPFGLPRFNKVSDLGHQRSTQQKLRMMKNLILLAKVSLEKFLKAVVDLVKLQSKSQ